MRWPTLALAVVAGCQGGSGKTGAAAADAPVAAVARDAAPVGPGSGAAVDEPADPDEPADDVAAEDLGAIPAWRAVVDRDQYLARRGQHGVVFGRVGDVAGTGPDRWLIDETEGNGALAIRVRYPADAPAPGTRAAVGGAWALDDARRWYWQADAVTALPADDAPAPVTADPPVAPGLVVVTADAPSPHSKVRLPDKVKDGDLMQFVVVSLPAQVGDGWGVSDQRWGTLRGYLRLPGEHVAYGGHDLRAADERWTLKKQSTYWVRVAKVRLHGDDPPTFDAATPPVRYP